MCFWGSWPKELTKVCQDVWPVNCLVFRKSFEVNSKISVASRWWGVVATALLWSSSSLKHMKQLCNIHQLLIFSWELPSKECAVLQQWLELWILPVSDFPVQPWSCCHCIQTGCACVGKTVCFILSKVKCTDPYNTYIMWPSILEGTFLVFNPNREIHHAAFILLLWFHNSTQQQWN